jgi:hypothetical protein
LHDELPARRRYNAAEVYWGANFLHAVFLFYLPVTGTLVSSFFLTATSIAGIFPGDGPATPFQSGKNAYMHLLN